VADTRDLRLTLTDNTDLYRHITSDRDLIINPLTNELPANFIATPSPFAEITGHTLIDTYLDKNNVGFFQGTAANARFEVVQLFDEVYRNSSDAWPCFTLESSPNSSIIGESVSFDMTATSRLTDSSMSGKSISLTAGDPALICPTTFNSLGKANCKWTFYPPQRTEKVLIEYKPPKSLPIFKTPPYSHVILAGGEQHWAGQFSTTSCTPLPADVNTYQPYWSWENPCYIHGPFYSSYQGYFYFDDTSADVVLGAEVPST
jgi:hypothetical protein